MLAQMEYLSVVPQMEKPMKLSFGEAKAFQKKGCGFKRKGMKNSLMDLHANNILLVFKQSRVNVKVVDSGGV